jgi:NitT/TauT family transport system substrate-binding protein
VRKFVNMKSRWSRIALATLVLAIAAGTAATVALAMPGKRSLTKVSVRMDFFAAGYHSWAYVAKAKGWYAKQGLDVSVEEGQGSSSTAQLVASGQDTFGFVSPIAAIQAMAGGANIKYVYVLHQRDGSGVLAPQGRGINTPKDLEGKTCAISAFGYIHQLLPAFWQKAGVDGSKVKLVTLSFDALIPSVSSGKIDADCEALSWGEPITFASNYGQKVNFFSFASYGLAPIGHGIIVNGNFLQQHPDLVKKFLYASQQGINFEAQNPVQAVTILHSQVKAFDTIPGDVAILNRSKLQLWRTKETKGKPLGWSPAAEWVKTVKLMEQYTGLKNAPGLSAIYTNNFVPGWAGNPAPR